MIIQCMECQARFRLADEKIKPTGTKVRCSKCKHVFTVMPPEPEPEPAEESVDYGDFNMEKVDEPESESAAPAASQFEPPSEPARSDELDFSGLEQEMDERADSGELADDFSFAATDQSEAETDESFQAEPSDETQEQSFDFDFEEQPAEETASIEADREPAVDAAKEDVASEQPDFAEAQVGPEGEFDFDQETAAPEEFGFGQDSESVSADSAEGEFDFSAEGEASREFSFDDESALPSTSDQPDEFSFDEPDETDPFAEDQESPSFETTAETGAQEFSFDDDEPAFGQDTDSEWTDDSQEEGGSFDFDEPSFETEAPERPAGGEEPESDLQFGEIDFSDSADQGGPGVAVDDDFSGASLAREEQVDTSYGEPEQEAPARPQASRDTSPLEAPAKKKGKTKRSGSRVLVLLVLLLLALGGGAGYLYLEGGGFDLQKIAQRFPFLQPYLGQPAATEAAPQIAINIASTSYVTNREAGQLLVIQGEAVNNYPAARSAITVKGILYDNQGNPLLQQTVFCGNPLGEEQLRTMPFADIEEAMNNQFGDSLSNMNVSSGAAIPFTIVFRNLPEDIANINIVVVDSEPGGG